MGRNHGGNAIPAGIERLSRTTGIDANALTSEVIQLLAKLTSQSEPRVALALLRNLIEKRFRRGARIFTGARIVAEDLPNIRTIELFETFTLASVLVAPLVLRAIIWFGANAVARSWFSDLGCIARLMRPNKVTFVRAFTIERVKDLVSSARHFLTFTSTLSTDVGLISGTGLLFAPANHLSQRLVVNKL